MAKGKLSITEKYAIQGMIHEGKPIADIAESLGRKPVTIEKYINGELEELVTNITRAKLQAANPEVEQDEEFEFEAQVSEDIFEAVVHKLKQAGMDRDKAEECIYRVLRKINFDPDNEQQLYALCIRNINAKDVMITRAAGGRKGVAVMTKAGSERGDEHKRRARKQKPSRKVRGNIFYPKEGRMEE